MILLTLTHSYYNRHDINRVKQPESRLISDMKLIWSDIQHAFSSAANCRSHLLVQFIDCLGLRPKLYTVELSSQLHDHRLFIKVGNLIRSGEIYYCQKVYLFAFLAVKNLLHSCPDGITTSVVLEMPYNALCSSIAWIFSAAADTNIDREAVAWSSRLYGRSAAPLSSRLRPLDPPEYISS